MMEYIILFIIIGIIIFINKTEPFIKSFFNDNNLKNKKLYPLEKRRNTESNNNLSKIYYKTSLLTKTEYAFYNILKNECNMHELIICPKVRLEDFINVKEIPKKQSYRSRIKSRHIDFLICNKNMTPLCGIELDDRTHNTWKAQKTDNFKNELYNAIGLNLYRIQTGTNYQTEIHHIIYNIKIKSTP